MTAPASVLNALTPLLLIAGLLQRIADLEDACTSARANVEREQDEHQAYRSAHKGSCPHPSCRLTLPHGHPGGA